MTDGEDKFVGQAQRPSIWVAALMVIGVVPFMAGLFALYSLLGVGMPYVGFFFLLYWAGILHQESSQFLPSVIGAMGGLCLGWALLTFLEGSDLRGQIAAGALLATVLFCFMRGHLKLLCNNGMMLFLIVSTIPDLHADKTVGVMIASLAVSAVYMGVVTLLIRLIASLIAKKQAREAL